MAKCVEFVGQGVPVRLSNEEAHQIVERDMDGQYCTKQYWRAWYDEDGRPRLNRAASR